MSSPVMVGILITTLVFLIWVFVRMPVLLGTRGGKITLLIGLLVLPLVLLGAGSTQSLGASKQKSFCMSCHEMHVYDTSLYIDDPEYIPAVHFQNRLVPQETACYTCHTDYTLYGDVHAKLNGLKHVWHHFFGTVPEPGQFKLYTPYPNDNCLQCHRGSRRFEKKSAHNKDGVTVELLYANQKSCVSAGCHDKIHQIKTLGEQEFWKEPAYPVPDALEKAPAADTAEDPFAAEGGDKPTADDPFADEKPKAEDPFADEKPKAEDPFADEKPAAPQAAHPPAEDPFADEKPAQEPRQ